MPYVPYIRMGGSCATPIDYTAKIGHLFFREVFVSMDEDSQKCGCCGGLGCSGGRCCCMLAGPDPVVPALAAGDVASTHNLMAAAARAPCAAAAAARRSFTCAAELGCGSIVRAGPVAGQAAGRVGSQGWPSGWGWQLAACGWSPQGVLVFLLPEPDPARPAAPDA